MRVLLFVVSLCLFGSLVNAAPEVTWTQEEYDPAPKIDRASKAADLIMPLPCGGAMAFMRVDTPARADDPLDDYRFRMGAPDKRRALYQYTRNAYIRGAFANKKTNTTYYYFGRYEVTRSQFDAVMAWADDRDCPERNEQTGRLPVVKISWFDAHQFAARFSEWSRGQTPDLMPKSDKVMGFYRLPGEAEWEFAARGGLAAKDTAAFNARQFEMSGKLQEYSWFAGRRSAGKNIKPIGVLKPNPLGLYDIYGNAEEYVTELFTMNRRGRNHGQLGGFITRGGSFRAKPSEISSATRNEYSFYSKGRASPNVSDNIGLRLILSNIVLNSRQVVFRAEDAWEQELNPDDQTDPRGLLTRMISDEAELAKRASLESVQSALINTLRDNEEATALALQRAVFLGANILRAMTDLRKRKAKVKRRIVMSEDSLDLFRGYLAEAKKNAASQPELETYQQTIDDELRTAAAARIQRDKYGHDLEVDGTNYVATLNAVYISSTLESLRREADILMAEMNRTNQLEMVKPIQGFVRLVEAYRLNPAMTRDNILAFKAR